jgi:hypothetical protein
MHIDENIQLFGYTIKLIDFGFTTMKTKKYIPKHTTYTKNITSINNNKYLDLLFLSINIVRYLKRFNKTNMKIYSILYSNLNKLFKKINLQIKSYLNFTHGSNKKTKDRSEFLKIDMVEHITKLDILYDIVDMTLYVNNNESYIFEIFNPQQFSKIIREGLN